jgi:hypothetical protein
VRWLGLVQELPTGLGDPVELVVGVNAVGVEELVAAVVLQEGHPVTHPGLDLVE